MSLADKAKAEIYEEIGELARSKARTIPPAWNGRYALREFANVLSMLALELRKEARDGEADGS